MEIIKFAFRGVPCVFLGYPSEKKGYKLLNMTSQLVFISRDVRIGETVIGFSILYPCVIFNFYVVLQPFL